MKVIRLQSENVMRLVAVDITPEGHLVLVGGKNGAGKTSVLQSIAMALGGAALVPEEPLRAGETEGKIKVDLGDLIITRTFRRGKNEDGTDGPTESKLTVTNAAGAVYPSPQALLDKMLGKLTFDPLSFKDDKKQAETLRKLVGLDFTSLNASRENSYNRRAILKKTLDIKAAQAMKIPFYKDTPAEEIPSTEINERMDAAERIRAEYSKADTEFHAASALTGQLQTRYELAMATVKVRSEALTAAQTALEAAVTELNQQQERATEANRQREEIKSRIPDTTEIRKRVAEIDQTNIQVRSNKQHALAQAELLQIQTDIDEQDHTIKLIDEEKQKRLRDAEYPVPGLALTEDGTVTFNGLPFTQASSSEQVRVSVAIGMALNPKLKILLVKNGNVLDEDSLKAVAEQVAKDDYQVWCEYVTKDASAVNIMIEDGTVVVTEPTNQESTKANEVTTPESTKEMDTLPF